MSGKKLGKKRILSYVTGLLYFYGLMDFEALYQAVANKLPGSLERGNFRAIMDKEILIEDSPYEFDFDEGFTFSWTWTTWTWCGRNRAEGVMSLTGR